MGILNREGFGKIIQEVQSKGISGTLLMLDIDKFKSVNDTFGHATGDLVLQAVADYLKQNCRPSDAIARWGGEEIVIFFPNATPQEIYEKFMSKDLNRPVINVPFDFHNELLRPDKQITFSGGMASLEPHDNLTEIIEKADKALYAVKQSDRNELRIAA